MGPDLWREFIAPRAGRRAALVAATAAIAGLVLEARDHGRAHRSAAYRDVLVARDLLDLMSREGKAPGGYNCPIEDIRLPFIFMNAVGLPGDVATLMHEGGHAFQGAEEVRSAGAGDDPEIRASLFFRCGWVVVCRSVRRPLFR